MGKAKNLSQLVRPIGYDSTTNITTIKSGASDTTAVTIDASQNATFAGTITTGGNVLSSASGFKNRIINGAMVIDQRNAGASVTPATSGTYSLDRWRTDFSQASKFSIQQNAGSVTPPAGYKNYLGITSLAATSVGASDYFFLSEVIEGYNAADLGFGAAGAATVTLSFWIRSSLTGTFGGCLRNGNGTRSYPFNYTISAANTWEQKSITIAGDTTGTWATGNTAGPNVMFGLGVGSTFSNTAGAWVAGNYFSATGAVSVVGTSGATFYITGVQLEKGSAATAFEYRPYGLELSLCQRYYVGGNVAWYSQGAFDTAYNTEGMFINLPVPMRTNPTVMGYVYFKEGHTSGSNSSDPANQSVAVTPTSFLLRWNNSSTAYRAYGYAGNIQPYLSAEF